MTWPDVARRNGQDPDDRSAQLLDELESWLDDDDEILAVVTVDRMGFGRTVLDGEVWLMVTGERCLAACRGRFKLNSIDLAREELGQGRLLADELVLEFSHRLGDDLWIEPKDEEQALFLLATMAALPPEEVPYAHVPSGDAVSRNRKSFNDGYEGDSARAPRGADGTVVDKLRELADMHAAGVLTDAEFQAAKARLLDR